MKKNRGYDVLVFYSGEYLSGSAYDAYEYFAFLRDNDIDAGLLLLVDVPEEDVKLSFYDRYFICPEQIDHIFIEKRNSNKVYSYLSKVILTTSIFSCAELIEQKYLLPIQKIIAMQETDSAPSIIKIFDGRMKDRILILHDDRSIGRLGDYRHKVYRKKLYFDIFLPYEDHADNCTLINMATKHKTLPPEDVKKIMDFYNFEKYLIYTQANNFEEYRVLQSEPGAIRMVNVVQAPIKNYLTSFDKFIYIQSKRNDPSPRILPECIEYGKEVFFYQFDENLKDGAYWRWQDCQNDFDSLDLNKEDEILEIVKNE